MDSINRPTYDIRQRPHLLIAVTGSEESEPPVRDVSAFLYDLNLLYEIARLATDPSYRHYTFSFRVWTRNNRPLSAQDQLIVHKLRLESPFDLSLLLPFVPKAVEAIRSVVGIAKELAGWRADTRIRSRPVRLQMDRQYGHRRQASTASRGRFSHSEVVLLLRPPSGSCDAGRKHVLSDRSWGRAHRASAVPQSSSVDQRSHPREHLFDQIPRQRFRELAASFLVINRAYLIA